jgi:predicted helicase
MQNFFKENLGLVTIRSESKQIDFSHAFLSSFVVDIHYSGGQTYLFPFYLYPSIDKQDMFKYQQSSKRKPNLNPKLTNNLTETHGKKLTPEKVFYYIYAVLYSNIYRTKYAEFLKIDFPRIPFTKKYDLFREMSKLGKRLIDLHLLKSTELDPPLCKFPIKGKNRVEKIKYDEKEKKIYFNEEQYFEEVPQEIWQYQIGGYQVCRKWLKDRKARCLSLEDITHYCKMVTALRKTIEVQQEIDNIYEEVEKNIIKS